MVKIEMHEVDASGKLKSIKHYDSLEDYLNPVKYEDGVEVIDLTPGTTICRFGDILSLDLDTKMSLVKVDRILRNNPKISLEKAFRSSFWNRMYAKFLKFMKTNPGITKLYINESYAKDIVGAYLSYIKPKIEKYWPIS